MRATGLAGSWLPANAPPRLAYGACARRKLAANAHPGAPTLFQR